MLIGASGGFSIKKMSRSERLFKSILRETSTHFSIWGLAWAEFARTLGYFWMKRGVGIAAFILLTVFGGSLYGAAKWLFPFLPIYGWALTFAATTILAEAFVIHYSGIAYERTQQEKVNELEERMWLLLDRLHPNLVLDYEPARGHPFIDTYNNGSRYEVTQYRITITSPIALDDAELVANRVRTASGEVHSNLHLRPMHDRRREGTKRVRLKAQKPEAWDVISTSQTGVHLNHIAPVGAIDFRDGVHEFELMATGGDRPPATKIARLEVNENIS